MFRCCQRPTGIGRLLILICLMLLLGGPISDGAEASVEAVGSIFENNTPLNRQQKFADRTIIVGGDNNYPPYEFLDADGQPAGYNVELTRAIARQLGIEVEIRLGPWETTRKRLANREIDIVQGMFYSPARDRSFDFTDPHTLVSHVAVVRAGTGIPQTLNDLAGRTILVMSGDIMHDLALQAGFGEQLLLAESQEQALELLAAGQGDCALIARLPALYWIQKNQLDQLRVGDKPFISPEYSYASHPAGRDLLERFSLALTDLKATGEYRKIHQQWLGVYDPSGIDAWQVTKYSLVIAGPIFLLLAASLAWSQSLKKLVRLRTLTLESEIAERRQAERELQASEARARLILDSAAEGIYGIDQDGNCIFCNRSCLELLGYAAEQELLGRNMHELIHHTTRDGEPHNIHACRIYSSFRTGEKIHLDDDVLWRADGSWFPAEYWSHPALRDGAVIGAVVSFIDISERHQAEQERADLQNQLHQAQKIESVGRLAGGVAHDYNNMLSVIIGFTELAQLKAAPDDPLQDCLAQILKAALRSRDITQQLLAFARKQTLEPKVLDINTTVENMLKMLKHLLGENIDLVWLPQSPLWPVEMDPTQLDQLLANLCVNARDAIADVGKLTIETSQASLDQAYCDDHPGFLPGDFVVLSVSDNGCGMDKDLLQHIFEPFFTTKETGTGTGLGLAMVYGVVKQSNGFVNVYSEPGQGTTFKVYLPRYHGEVETQPVAMEFEDHQGDNRTVLVVEDEPAILNLIEAILQDFGYQVLAADSPSMALELARQHGHDIPLLITDVVMPEMNGRQLAERLRELCPRIRTLYMSGYTANAIAHHGVLDEDINFLHKPFSKQDLSRQIKKILGPER